MGGISEQYGEHGSKGTKSIWAGPSPRFLASCVAISVFNTIFNSATASGIRQKTKPMDLREMILQIEILLLVVSACEFDLPYRFGSRTVDLHGTQDTSNRVMHISYVGRYVLGAPIILKTWNLIGGLRLHAACVCSTMTFRSWATCVGSQGLSSMTEESSKRQPDDPRPPSVNIQ